MGFVFDEFEKDKKVYVNLSESALLVIEQDMENFCLDGEKNKAGFLNKVFANFYPTADASINTRYISKREYLKQLFDEDEFKGVDLKTKAIFIDKISSCYKNDLLEKSKSYVKGKAVTFRLNIANTEILRDDSNEDINYEGSLGLYLKAIFEEYSLKSNYEREQIFFRENVDSINASLSDKYKLKLTIKSKISVRQNKEYNRKFYITPYKIVQDTTKTFNYLIGYAEEIYDNNNVGEKTISSFRISRMDRLVPMRSMKAFISKENKDKIDKELVKKLPQFMAGKLIDVKIKFTKKGLESFNRQIYMKPMFYDIIDKENLIYNFHCTKVQAINYFFKLARDIEVLEPEDLRENFVNRYKDALNVYNNEEL